MSRMQRLEYTVRFVTPAFLGGADQSAQWRTPPFKALIRQWWRIVHAPQVNYAVDVLRRDEDALFGVAADGGDSRQSLVRLRLSGGWNMGAYNQLEDSGRVCHPEVDKGGPPCDNGPGRKISANLYLGYGPIGNNGLTRPHAIAPESHNNLVVCAPDSKIMEIERAIQLAAWFGTIGSRSRNGWGALQIVAGEGTPAIPDMAAARLADVLRPLNECLDKDVGCDWPHAIGSVDSRPLVWTTDLKSSWREVMRDLARIKIAFRTQPELSLNGVPPGSFSKRHLLAYPVGSRHNVNGNGWGSKGRLANQLRFKVERKDGKWYGVIVHLPCRLPSEMASALPEQDRNNLDAMTHDTWQAVHTVLDQHATRMQ